MTIIDVDFLLLIGNEYIFYLVTDTLAFGTGGIPKPFVVTRSRAAVGIGSRGAGKQNRSVFDAMTKRAPFTVVFSSRFKRKRANTTRPGTMR